jgi:hypothetical protein
MQKVILLLCAAASIALLGGCQSGDDGAPSNPNAPTATPGAVADPAQNTEKKPEGAQNATGTSSVSPDPKAGLNPNANGAPPTSH